MVTTAGLQLPFIPLSDTVGRTGTFPPAQMLSVFPKLKVGVIFDTTVNVKVVGKAHCPAVGVKV